MKKVARLFALSVGVGFILLGFVVGHEAEGAGGPAPFCPGQSVPWSLTALGQTTPPIVDGDTVVGTRTLTGLVYLTCQVNAPTTGTCNLSPDGSTISFNLVVHSPTSPSGDISGTYEVPPGGPDCGTIVGTTTLTEPHAYSQSGQGQYACPGTVCYSAIPAVSGPGLAVMALLLAVAAVFVLRRR